MTYLSLGASPELDHELEAALGSVGDRLGLELLAAGDGHGARAPAPGITAFDELRSPIDRRRVVARIERGTAADAARAVEAAHAAFPAWRALGWRRRGAILAAAAETIAERRLELAAWMVHEIGKTRLEALAEVEESAELLRYYVRVMSAEDGFRRPMARLAPTESTESVLRPYGAWAVISPFNFPSALAAGMVGAALLAGNTVVLKPSELAPVSAALLVGALRDAGVPAGALELVFGDGAVGRALAEHPRTAGVAFTGSYQVGMGLVRGAARDWPRPVVAEMGGKNACLVGASADLEAAAAAVARSAFGFGGQKCSACSRVFVARGVEAAFVEALIAAAGRLPLGSPLERSSFLGPVIDRRAVERFEAAVAETRAAGGEVLAGGAVRREGELAHGHYVEPTVVRLPDPDHRLLRDELFLPLVAVEAVAGLEQGLSRANDSRFGLTAGLFSRDADEVERFLDAIEAGVLYVNRASGATTGAWPGVNPFGGWKGSGSTGPAALGPHYLLRFLREQSRAITRPGASGASAGSASAREGPEEA